MSDISASLQNLKTLRKTTQSFYTQEALASFAAFLAITYLQESKKDFRTLELLDNSVGSGNLLIGLIQQISESSLRDCELELRLQELRQEALEECLSKVSSIDSCRISVEHHCGDLFCDPGKFINHGTADLCVINPPWNIKKFYKQDAHEVHKFSKFKSLSGIGGFIFSALESINADGVEVVITSRGFASSKRDTDLRKYLIDNRNLVAVYAIDSCFFDSTSLPCYVLVLKKNYATDSVLVCDASGLPKIPLSSREYIEYISSCNQRRVSYSEFEKNSYSWSHLLYLKEELQIPSLSDLVTKTSEYAKVSISETQTLAGAVQNLEAYLKSLEG